MIIISLLALVAVSSLLGAIIDRRRLQELDDQPGAFRHSAKDELRSLARELRR